MPVIVVDMRRGERFAERIGDLVEECGPSNLSQAEQSDLSNALISFAVEWAMAYNRKKRGILPPKGDA